MSAETHETLETNTHTRTVHFSVNRTQSPCSQAGLPIEINWSKRRIPKVGVAVCPTFSSAGKLFRPTFGKLDGRGWFQRLGKFGTRGTRGRRAAEAVKTLCTCVKQIYGRRINSSRVVRTISFVTSTHFYYATHTEGYRGSLPSFLPSCLPSEYACSLVNSTG